MTLNQVFFNSLLNQRDVPGEKFPKRPSIADLHVGGHDVEFV